MITIAVMLLLQVRGLVVVLEHESFKPPRPFIREITTEARRIFKDDGTPVRFRAQWRKDPLAGRFDTLAEQHERLRELGRSGLNQRIFRRKRVNFVHYVVSPMNESNGAQYLGGIAHDICSTDRIFAPSYAFSMGNASERHRTTGESRKEHSAVIIAHEIGHTVGMWHVESPTIMHAAALHLIPNLGLFFDPLSLIHERQCREFRHRATAAREPGGCLLIQ
jgi:hypothetical protein